MVAHPTPTPPSSLAPPSLGPLAAALVTALTPASTKPSPALVGASAPVAGLELHDAAIVLRPAGRSAADALAQRRRSPPTELAADSMAMEALGTWRIAFDEDIVETDGLQLEPADGAVTYLHSAALAQALSPAVSASWQGAARPAFRGNVIRGDGRRITTPTPPRCSSRSSSSRRPSARPMPCTARHMTSTWNLCAEGGGPAVPAATRGRGRTSLLMGMGHPVTTAAARGAWTSAASPGRPLASAAGGVPARGGDAPGGVARPAIAISGLAVG